MDYRYLSLNELLVIHSEILRKTGGEDGILFQGNLELCIETPKRETHGFEPNKTISQKAASLIYEINKLHPFFDGNKRTAFAATLQFLILNGYEIEAQEIDIIIISLIIAKCKAKFNQVVNWMEIHIKTVVSY